MLIVSLLCMQFALAQDWNYRLVSSSDDMIKVEINVNGYSTRDVVTPNGDAVVVMNKNMVRLAEAGEPNVPSFVLPVIIGDDALMDMEVVDAQYIDYENINIAPSKGDFPRTVNPDDMPYTYGAMYQQDAFYPKKMAKLDEPYIQRDLRVQNMMVTPYLYNPVTKTLRVFSHFTLIMKKTGADNRNVIASRSKSIVLDSEFKNIYESRYINYAEAMTKYTPVDETGWLLIICHDAFMTAMEPFVAWKKQIGRTTIMVGTSETGNTTTALKSYIQNFYNENPSLTDVLLVGDVAQIPGYSVSAGDYSGKGDLPYGQLAGNDSYNEVIVGRFCCETEAQVTNHVNKVLNYERDLDETATWLTTGMGISTTSQAGHYGESDYQHIDNIREDLLGYTYTNIYRDYEGVSGTTATSAMHVSQHINAGVSIINYCNHGSETSWAVFNYGKSNVNYLTNDYKLPYIVSVACLVGKYDYSSGCFAEAWMRATDNNNGNPTGAIGGMFSYISQPWLPPMYAQDEIADIMTESFSNRIRRTMGGVSLNGNLRVLDLGATNNLNKGTYNCWLIYGDPTLTLRTDVPTVMSVTGEDHIDITDVNYTVYVTDGEDALATLSRDGEIMGSAIVTDGVANITFSAQETPGVATLTVFGYNKKTYVTSVIIGDAPIVCPAPVNYNGVNYWDEGEFGARLAWDRADYESTLDRFEVYRAQEGEEFVMVHRIVNTPSITHYECTDQVSKGGIYTYRIIAFYQNGCESEPLDIDVEVIDYTSTDENMSGNVSLYPNPASDKVSVKAQGIRQVTVVNITGQMVLTQDVDNDEVVIDMSAFENGMYLVGITTDYGKVVKILNVLR